MGQFSIVNKQIVTILWGYFGEMMGYLNNDIWFACGVIKHGQVSFRG